MSSSPEGVYEPGVIDPGFPVPKPTTPFWHSQPHPLANHQSAWPTTPVDVVIIGAGVTGTNLARTLLKREPSLYIVVVEARGLCSGATGRNGGHIKTMAFAVWEDRKAAYGIEEAIRLTEFEQSHLAAMTSAARENGIDCDVVFTEGVDAYFVTKSFDKALAALRDMQKHAPHLAKQYTVYTDQDHLRKVLKLSNRCVGAIGVAAASIWPYKFITGLIGPLIESGKVNVQTDTLVQSIDDDANQEHATVNTNRGKIQAKNVVHATNGWLGHLLPELRPYISPVRGNVVHMTPISNDSKMKGQASCFGFESSFSYWLRYAEKDYDYLIQRREGDVVVGRANTGRRATGSDAETDLVAMAHLRGVANEVGIPPSSTAGANVDYSWSGILAFTQDTQPFVGRLDVFPNRSHQWICGGYHGIGMTKAFRSAEMLAHLLLREDVPAEYPLSMLISQDRVTKLDAVLGKGVDAPKAKL